MTHHRLALAIAAALSIPCAHADIILAPITVTATQEAATPVTDQLTEHTPLQSPKADAGEALRLIPGVSGSRMGQHGIDPIIRGQTADQLNVLIDGGYVFAACPNRMDPPTSFGSLMLYDRVVVEKGVQSLLHGPGGSGGTILFERDTAVMAAEPGLRGRLSFGVNDNGLHGDLGLDMLMSNGQGYVRVLGEALNAGNYEDGDGNEVPSSMKKRAVTLIGGYRFDDHSGIEASVDRSRITDARYAGAGMDSPEDELTAYRLKGWTEALDGPVNGVKAELWRSDVDHVMDNFSLREPVNPMMLRRSPTTSRTSGGRLILTSQLDRAEVDYGVDVRRVDRDAVLLDALSGDLLFRTWPDARQDNLGLFAQADVQTGVAGLLRGGLRVDRHESSIDSGLEGDSIANATAPWVPQGTAEAAGKTRRDTQVSALLRYEHALNGSLTAFTGLSRTVRQPDATELYFYRPHMTERLIGNPALDAEKHHQLDLGVVGQGPRLSYEAALFYDRVEDFILRDDLGTTLSFRNVRATLWGAELSAGFRLHDDLILSGALAYVRGRNDSDGRDLPQIPPLNGHVGVEYQPAHWLLGARARFADKQTRIDTLGGLDTIETPAWAVLDLYGSYRVNRQLEMRAGVDNLFDRHYAEHVNRNYSDLFGDPSDRIYEPGRTLWARVNVTF